MGSGWRGTHARTSSRLTKSASHPAVLLAERRAPAGPYRRPRWGQRSQLHSKGVDAIVSACIRNTEDRRIPRMQTALFMCYEKHDSKGKRKQLCSTFTVSRHVKCEGDESEAQTGRAEERRGMFQHTQIVSRWWQGTGLSDTRKHASSPSASTHACHCSSPSPPSRLKECVKCPTRGEDSKTVFTRSTLSPLLTACEELLSPPLMYNPNGEAYAGSHCIC